MRDYPTRTPLAALQYRRSSAVSGRVEKILNVEDPFAGYCAEKTFLRGFLSTDPSKKSIAAT